MRWPVHGWKARSARAAAALLALLTVRSSAWPQVRNSVPPCQKALLFSERNVSAWSLSERSSPERSTPERSTPETGAFFFAAGLNIDADGAYKAYHPRNRPGLDSLDHAGRPGHWWALVTDNNEPNGHPVVQRKSDPAPGYYVSATSLFDPNVPNLRDPRRYVDSAHVPYVALTLKALKHARLGDFVTVVNLRSGGSYGAIVADVTDSSLPLGEGSIALAEALGVESSPRDGGIEHGGFAYIVYPGSGNGHPRSLDEIQTNAKQLFDQWGGPSRLTGCLPH